MLVPFIIEPDAVLMGSETDLARRRAAHERCLEQWLKYGLLILWAPRGDGTSFQEKISQLPPASKKLWLTALTKYRRIYVPNQISNEDMFLSIESLNKWSEHYRLALLDDLRAVIDFDVPEEAFSRIIPETGLEICRYDTSDRAIMFRDARKKAMDDICQGDACADVWLKKFATLAKHSRHVCVVDRYCALKHRDRLQRNQDRGLDDKSGLRQFIEFMSSTSTKSNINVFACCEEHVVDKIDVSLNEILYIPKGGINALWVHLVDETVMQRLAHNRYFRFDTNIFDVDIGLEIFEGMNCWRRSTCNIRFEANAARQLEQELRTYARKSIQLMS